MSTHSHRPRHGQPSRVGSLALSLSALLALSGPVLAQEADAEADPASSTPTSVRIAAALGSDAEAIFRYVADEIRYEPYSGVLRGAAATWYNRAGNSADQSLLLARLLEGADIRYRFALGPIDETSQAALLDGALLDAGSIRAAADEAITALIPDETAAELPAPAAAASETAAAAEAENEAADAWTATQLLDDLALLDEALAGGGTELDAGFTDVPLLEADQHVWVQADLDGTWVDLDPSLAGATYGEALTTAAETPDALPAEMEHLVTLKVIAEVLADGALVEEVLAQVAAPAHELAGQPISIINLGTDSVPTLARTFQSVMGQISYSPVIVVGRDQYGGRPMTFSEPGGGGFFASSDAPETTAEWIELGIDSPGGEPVTVRRALFDRVGPAARAAGGVTVDSLASLETVDLPDSDGELLPLLSGAWLSVATGLPQRDAPITQLEPGSPGIGAITPFSQHMVTELAGLDYALPMGVRPFVDAPNVAALSWQLGVDDGVPTNRFVSDIWHRSHGTAPVAGVDAQVTPSLVPGVLSHLAERLVAGAGRSEAEPEASVGSVFDAASEAGIGWRLATSAADIEGLPFDADVLERLRASIAAGQVAVVPEATVSIDGTERTGWWLIDTASGRVSDQLDDGRGSVIQEYVEQVDAAITIYKDLKCVFDKVLPLWQQAISHVQALGTGSAVAYSAPAPTFLVSCVPKPS